MNAFLSSPTTQKCIFGPSDHPGIHLGTSDKREGISGSSDRPEMHLGSSDQSEIHIR